MPDIVLFPQWVTNLQKGGALQTNAVRHEDAGMFIFTNEIASPKLFFLRCVLMCILEGKKRIPIERSVSFQIVPIVWYNRLDIGIVQMFCVSFWPIES
jgi:hypothetical protein